MASTSFGGWMLSSSDDDEDIEYIGTKSINKASENDNISTKPSKDLLDISMEELEYIPLSERLKRKQEPMKSGIDEELPVFDIKNDQKLLSVPKNDKENCILGSKPSAGFIKSDPKSRSPRKVKKVSDNSETKQTSQAKIDKKEDAATRKEDAATRKAMNEHLKSLKPEECMKHMMCSVSQLITGMFDGFNFMDELQKDFQPTCSVEYFHTPCVRWQRRVTLTDEGHAGSTELHDEPEMLVVVPASEFVKMVQAYMDHTDEPTLTSWVKQLQNDNPRVNIHLVCHGVEKYNKDLTQRRKKQANSSKRKKPPYSLPDVSPDDIEESLVDLQVECNTTVLYFEKPSELVTMIKQLTKSVGEAPYKRMKRQDVLFINEIPSVKINPKTGEGVEKVWKQMIQQVQNVTPVMASAIADKYPTVLSLMKAYESCGEDTKTAEALLASIPVRRGVGTIQTNRRIGPELSYRIYRMLASTDPNEYLY